MMKMTHSARGARAGQGRRLAVVALGLACAWPAVAQVPGSGPAIKQQAAVRMVDASHAQILAAVRAGARIVAVGDHGVVLLSDDDGVTYRQATVVPTRATLTAVHFVGDKDGWAVGHLGVVLHTVDGGETWSLQRDDLSADRPLFGVWFRDRENGFAVGLWGLLLQTTDGGAHWEASSLPPSPGKTKPSDKNLFAVFPGSHGEIFLAAERGTVFKSSDGGQHWVEIDTGNAGTFWTGLTLRSGALLVGGLRGRMFRGDASGTNWSEVQTGSKSSITSIAELPDGSVIAVGLDGVSLRSIDDGHSFVAASRQDRLPLTAVLPARRGAALVFSSIGPVKAK